MNQPADTSDPRPEPAPRIWLVIGDKPGDNAQIDMIAGALGMPLETRRLLPKPQFVLGKPRYRPSLEHLDLERSDPLQPPWPDFILTIGRRPSMAALWIQEQSRGHSRIILLGRPKKWIERFALVIVPGQYRLPERDNVLQLELPLMKPARAAIEQAARDWQTRFDKLARPVTALLVGGQTKPYRFDAAAAREMLARTRGLLEHDGGTLYVSTSRRTPDAVEAVLQNELPENAILYRWNPDASADNPYHALLGLADRFIVTGDSMSMMVEVARMGKPLAIYPLPVQGGPVGALRRSLAVAAGGSGVAAKLLAALQRSGLFGYSRDLGWIHETLYRRGLAVPLGEPFPPGGSTPEDELERVATRVREVIGRG